MPLLFSVTTAVRKHHDQKQFGVQRGLFSLHVSSHSPLRVAKAGLQAGRNLEARADAEATEECSYITCLPYFLKELRAISRVPCTTGCVLPYQSLGKKNAFQVPSS